MLCYIVHYPYTATMGDKKPPRKPGGPNQYSESAVAESKTNPALRPLMRTHQQMEELAERKRALAESLRNGVPQPKKEKPPPSCLTCHRPRNKETKWNRRGKYVHNCLNIDGSHPCPAFASGDINDCLLRRKDLHLAIKYDEEEKKLIAQAERQRAEVERHRAHEHQLFQNKALSAQLVKYS